MKDKLKDFVNEHRDEFDVFEPRPELWQEICQDLPESRKEKEGKVIKISFGERASFSADFFFMRVAAAVVLLLGCGLTLYLMKQQVTKEPTPIAAIAPAVSTESIAPELAEVEAYYVSQIQEKKSQLSAYDRKVLGLDEQAEIDLELARLDNSYLQLKKQLYTNPNTSEIVDAMVQNLQIRIKVLNRQLEVLQQLEQMEQEPTNEPQKDDTTNV
ncbi:hypothetical protein CLV24_10193 [Pontibacter ummariensis]|uniref:Anti-sigma factor n=1 Tax=Pontibacter ummariensis TaxID=1610492 RepID=A0A239B1L8_9BACT|nr:hypothetical protein [Pontibacter ummariensis]PRY16249.1 hypothetical protein CLV24_10193 [Pontibacter ummariensis]SNS01845.1 hypothetical protein SAMN06296052_10193 [Pontibacter ummariensis]